MPSAKVSRVPPSGPPEGTIWFGGPVDRFKITLRILGEDVDPDRISKLLGCQPTPSRSTKGRWALSIKSADCSPDDEPGDGVRILLNRLPSDLALWADLNANYRVDLFCGIFLGSPNQGLGLSPEVSRMLAARGLEIGFDIYAQDHEKQRRLMARAAECFGSIEGNDPHRSEYASFKPQKPEGPAPSPLEPESESSGNPGAPD
jgi:hypothetical protein